MTPPLFQPWGRYPRVDQRGIVLHDRYATLPDVGASVLPFGNGRSYGDSCLNSDGVVMSTRRLDRFITFDREAGVLRCEAGVLLSDILDVAVDAGWFLPVTPGTRFVTVGGAIANDVHGKNHHVAGTFGRYVDRFELLRSTGERLTCSPDENAALFSATIGGLGLTGLITWAELRLKPIVSNAIDMENIKYGSLSDFFRLSEDSDEAYEYTMTWVDCTASGAALGRGHFSRGNHVENPSLRMKRPGLRLALPFTPPVSAINRLSLKLFNFLYYERQRRTEVRRLTHYQPFFYPLDAILNWNRAYGPRGFLQYQCVIPEENSRDALREVLSIISRSGLGSALAVLKICGDLPSPGLMSFPLRGASLALDFPFVRDKTLPLFARLDDVVVQAGGRLYPAKDAHMSGQLFRRFYPAWKDMLAHQDPAFNSDLWRRVTACDEESN